MQHSDTVQVDQKKKLILLFKFSKIAKPFQRKVSALAKQDERKKKEEKI